MIRFTKTKPLKLRKSTVVTRFLARPVVRFGLAGLLSIFITVLLFTFMMYITHFFPGYKSFSSRVLYNLKTITLPERKYPRQRVQRPPELLEEPAPPAELDFRKSMREQKQTAETTAEDDSGGDNKTN
jgi:hypothetical protein